MFRDTDIPNECLRSVPFSRKLTTNLVSEVLSKNGMNSRSCWSSGEKTGGGHRLRDEDIQTAATS